jgi:hypothetical protein
VRAHGNLVSAVALKSATSRFDKLGRDNPDYPRVAARPGPASSAQYSTPHAPNRAEGPRICSTNAALRGDPVLVDQATEPVGSLELLGAGELP